jgi:carbon storage regulator
MLILTRRVGESIRISDNICITIMDVDGKSIKIGIDAPKSISIHREEVFLRIKEENQKAAGGALDLDLGTLSDLFKKKDI